MQLIRRPGVFMMPSVHVVDAIIPCHQHRDNSAGGVGKDGTTLTPVGKLLGHALGRSLRSDDPFAGTVVTSDDTQPPPSRAFSMFPRGSKFIAPSIAANRLCRPMGLEVF